MRRSAPWMCQLDERIIEHLHDEPWTSPHTMAAAFRATATKAKIRERCEVLSEAGLIGPLWEGAGLYELTTSGRLYLEGQLDAEAVPAPGPVRVGPPPERRGVRG